MACVWVPGMGLRGGSTGGGGVTERRVREAYVSS